MRKLVGPTEVNRSWSVDGVTYTASGGVVTPTPPENHVDHFIYGAGFYWKDDAPVAPLDKLDKSTDIRK
jgi:hypothetical protein